VAPGNGARMDLGEAVTVFLDLDYLLVDIVKKRPA
jgi:hypothetical protein